MSGCTGCSTSCCRSTSPRAAPTWSWQSARQPAGLVAIAEGLAARYREQILTVAVTHRDIDKRSRDS